MLVNVEIKLGLCFNLPVESSVYIGLGSNEGDRELHLLRAIAEIGKLHDTKITALSPFYNTEPVGNIVQPDFLNAVARISTNLTPYQLLAELQHIETHVFHRRRIVPGGSRPMDLDLLFHGELVIDGADLVLPHPRLHERRFVLRPLADIAPDLIHPVLHKRISDLLHALGSGGRVNQI